MRACVRVCVRVCVCVYEDLGSCPTPCGAAATGAAVLILQVRLVIAADNENNRSGQNVTASFTSASAEHTDRTRSLTLTADLA